MKNRLLHTEALLARVAIHSDEKAFRNLFEHYFPKLMPFAIERLGNSHAAEEVISDVFIGLWRKRGKLTEIQHLERYLYTSVRNRCANYLRNNKRRNQIWMTGEYPELTVAENPETLYTSSELKSLLITTIENLPPRCRLIFRMVREEGKKYREVADLLAISVKTVDVQVGRAVTRIRKAVQSFNQERTDKPDQSSESIG